MQIDGNKLRQIGSIPIVVEFPVMSNVNVSVDFFLEHVVFRFVSYDNSIESRDVQSRVEQFFQPKEIHVTLLLVRAQINCESTPTMAMGDGVGKYLLQGTIFGTRGGSISWCGPRRECPSLRCGEGKLSATPSASWTIFASRIQSKRRRLPGCCAKCEREGELRMEAVCPGFGFVPSTCFRTYLQLQDGDKDVKWDRIQICPRALLRLQMNCCELRVPVLYCTDKMRKKWTYAQRQWFRRPFHGHLALFVR